jgi:hypothetical protein
MIADRSASIRSVRSWASLASVLSLSAVASAQPSPVRWDTRGEVSGYYDSDHVRVLTPAVGATASDPSAGWSADASYLVDIVSAASVDIVSEASPRWNEVRQAGTLGLQYKPNDLGIDVSGATSVEPDFASIAGGIGGSADFAQKNVTLFARYVYEHDIAGRTGTPFSVYGLRLDRHELSAGVSIVMDRATTLEPALDVMLESGRQEKPYRWLPLFDRGVVSQVPPGASVDQVNQLRLPGRVSERVPDARQRYAASVTLAHRFDRSTLKLWDRVYTDSWGLLATTADVRWIMSLSRRWSLWPHARLNAQTGVDFWRRAYVGSVGPGVVVVPENRTGDRELSPLWSATLGPGARWDIGATDPRNMSLSLEIEGTYTDFRDTLYIDHRWAGLAIVGFSASF